MADLDYYKKKLHSDFRLNGMIVRSELCSFIIESLAEANISLSSNYEGLVKIICEDLESYCEYGRSIERSDIERAIAVVHPNMSLCREHYNHNNLALKKDSNKSESLANIQAQNLYYPDRNIQNSICLYMYGPYSKACIDSRKFEYETRWSIISAFEIPKLDYDLSRKCYTLSNKAKPRFFDGAELRNELFNNRYRNVFERTRRNEQFKENLRLHTVDYLLTVSSRKLDNGFVLGSLYVGSIGKYYLEDPNGMVELNLEHAKYHNGFFCENCFVLVNGLYTGNVLQVATMLLPPGEEYIDSKLSFGNLNYFGGESKSLLRDSVKLNELMNENVNGLIAFLSDVWIDKQLVLEKLEKLFEGFVATPPIAFVFLGNFLSDSYPTGSADILMKAFTHLGELIQKFENILANSHFVFVPGFNDPAMPNIVPRMPLPNVITTIFKQLVPNSTFTTNPCRIQYCTKQIVLFRADLLSKFMQQTLIKPSKEKTEEFLVKTVISQAHLSPFSLNVQPVHWSFDHCLHLYPLPDLVVIGDSCNSYDNNCKGCSVINPGSFMDGFQFKTYVPAVNIVDHCVLENLELS